MPNVYSNIIEKEQLRAIQEETLKTFKNALVNSFGPYGSNTEIFKDSSLNTYTKDGQRIVENIKILFPIESSIQRDLLEITTSTVKNIGDGTTGATILSYEIFKTMTQLEDKYIPYDLMRKFDKAVKNIKEDILSRKVEFTPELAYKISMISTNGNEEVSQTIKQLYEDHGNDLYISVQATTRNETMLKEYDGLTMKEGLYSSVYINNVLENKCELHSPRIYMFDDPVDNVAMLQFFDQIVYDNIIDPVRQRKQPIPTVILTPFISKDGSATMESIEATMANAKGYNKPPLLIVNNIFKNDNVSDITKLCGCKPIKKYIDRKKYEEDVERGLAPTIENIASFCGSCEAVISTTSETTFINPMNMIEYDENGLLTGNYSHEYYALIDYIKGEIANATANSLTSAQIGSLKKRLHALRCNMVEYIIGGMSLSDREALKDLVDDAVLNCRSAAEYGVGYGANFEGLYSSAKLYRIAEDEGDDLAPIYLMIHTAYKELYKTLLSTARLTEEEQNKIYADTINNRRPYNLLTKEFDGLVLSSIMSDPAILDALSKLLTLLITCNQFLLEKPDQMGFYSTRTPNK